MKPIHISELRNSNVLRIYSQREYIQIHPEYQRMGDIWTLEKKQLLIDSILNDFDIPKLYFHEFPETKVLKGGRKFKYAIIDGRQRLEAIWGFINNEFSLSDEFIFFADKNIKAASLTYKEIAEKYPEVKGIFDSFSLPIISVITDDIDLIEEMFSRLNEAMPLNAAEKRNALGGPMPVVIRRIENNRFFKINVPFSNNRYQHREIACKMLYLENLNKIMDTKKVYLDAFVKEFKKNRLDRKAKDLEKEVAKNLNSLSDIFTPKDGLLRSQGMVIIYYLVIREANKEDFTAKVTRKKLLDFEKKRQANRVIAEEDISKANYDLLEFDRMTLQGTNDGASIKFRLETLLDYLKK